MTKKICSFFILLSLTFGMSSQLGAFDYGNVPEFIMPAGNDLSIDLDYLFGGGQTDIRIYHADGRFNHNIVDGASTFIICNLTPEDSGVVIIEARGADGFMYTYAFRLTVVESLDPNRIINRTLNILNYEE